MFLDPVQWWIIYIMYKTRICNEQNWRKYTQIKDWGL